MARRGLVTGSTAIALVERKMARDAVSAACATPNAAVTGRNSGFVALDTRRLTVAGGARFTIKSSNAMSAFAPRFGMTQWFGHPVAGITPLLSVTQGAIARRHGAMQIIDGGHHAVHLLPLIAVIDGWMFHIQPFVTLLAFQRANALSFVTANARIHRNFPVPGNLIGLDYINVTALTIHICGVVVRVRKIHLNRCFGYRRPGRFFISREKEAGQLLGEIFICFRGFIMASPTDIQRRHAGKRFTLRHIVTVHTI